MRRQDKNGFTLIELLVVIAILALLLSVILPALNSAKLAARQVVCAAQMKQWALAEMAYTGENNNQVTPYADTMDRTKGGNALNPETYWYNRLSPYLTEEYYGKRGMNDVRKCPMGKDNFGEKAVWIGVYYSSYLYGKAPFIFMNDWNGTTLIKRNRPVKMSWIRMPSNYLMMLDTQRDFVFSPFHWVWDEDSDRDGMNDHSKTAPSHNFARPKIHRGGCNVALFDGHVEWIRYEDFWDYADGYPTHQYWYNGNRPVPVAALPNSP